MKKVIFIGKNNCGKTSLCQSLNGEDIRYKNTQVIERYKDTIDTPGQYIENMLYYGALIITAAEADIIALVQEYGDNIGKIPPAFGATFGRRIIGIITKIDKVRGNYKSNYYFNNDKKNLEIEEQLKAAGADKIFKVSILTGEGIEDLKEFLNSDN